MRLLFLIVFIGLNAFSQKINLGDLRDYQNSSLDTLRQEFYVYMKDCLLTVNLNNFEKRLSPLAYEESISADNSYLTLPVIHLQDAIYFIQSQGGLVFTFKNDTLKRIDNSFDHGMQYGAPIFEHEGTLFKYGGYGFWSNRDFFTYFDINQNEWEVYHPIQSDITPSGRAHNYFVKNKNLFHVFGGSTVNPNNRREQLSNNELWTFDFKTTTWHFLGEYAALETALKTIPYHNKLVALQEKHITVIDIERNTKTVYRHSPVSAQHNSFLYAGHADGRFYILLPNMTGAYLSIVEEEDFFGEIVEQTKFYKNQTYWLKKGGAYALVISVIILVFWLVKNFYSKRNKIVLLENGLRYKNKYTEFDKESMSILRLLLAEADVSSGDILRLVEKDQYSSAHNERIKVQKINDINLKVATLAGINYDVISSFKSPKDRRIRLYKMNKGLFRIRTPKN